MSARTKSRKRALDILFESELQGLTPGGSLAGRRELNDPPVNEYTVQLVEGVVADQERITRQIIEFLGLPWDDRCLRYWESDRTVRTLSYDQVNQPIYDTSIGRWRNYEKHLSPLKRALGMDAGCKDL